MPLGATSLAIVVRAINIKKAIVKRSQESKFKNEARIFIAILEKLVFNPIIGINCHLLYDNVSVLFL